MNIERKVQFRGMPGGYVNISHPLITYAKYHYNDTKQCDSDRGLRVNLPVADFGCCKTQRDVQGEDEYEAEDPPSQLVKVVLDGEPMSYLNYKEVRKQKQSMEPSRSHKKVPIDKVQLLSEPRNSDQKKVKVARPNVVFEAGYQQVDHRDRLKQLTQMYYDKLSKDPITTYETPKKQPLSERKLLIPKLETLSGQQMTSIRRSTQQPFRNSPNLQRVIEPVSIFSSRNRQSRASVGQEQASKKNRFSMMSTVDHFG